jgi:hypothetical protein
MTQLGSIREDQLATIFAAMMRRSSTAVGKPFEIDAAMLTLAGGAVHTLSQKQVLYGPSGLVSGGLVVCVNPEHTLTLTLTIACDHTSPRRNGR